MKSDNLMINCLGRYEAFPWRWQGSNNIVLRADALKVPVFLAHGTSDKVVPWAQTESLLKAIESAPGYTLRSSEFSKSNKNVGFIRSSFVKNAGHDYVFWNEAGLKALDYFDALLSD
jgi:pimeloyl-ACP methyl ester carboxylesterase